jgi:hypothetical protein
MAKVCKGLGLFFFMEVSLMKRALLTLAAVVCVAGCNNVAELFGKTVVGGTGQAIGASAVSYVYSLIVNALQ